MSQFVQGTSASGKVYKSSNITLGGLNNGNGSLKVLDEYGELSVLLDKLGMTLGNGRKIIGGDGLLTSIIIEGNIWSDWFIGGTVFLPVGFNFSDRKSSIMFEFNVPKGFTILTANIILQHIPIYHDAQAITGYSRNLRLYKANSYSNSRINLYINSRMMDFVGASFSQIDNAFGSPGFTGSPTEYTSVKSINIKDFISTSKINDSFNILKIETANNAVDDNDATLQTGACRATLIIYGYTPFE